MDRLEGLAKKIFSVPYVRMSPILLGQSAERRSHSSG